MSSINTTKKIIFRIIGLTLILTFFVIVEVTLVLLDYGTQYTLFIPDNTNPNYLVLNPDLSEKFSLGKKVNPPLEFIRKEKPKNEIRIFVLGASTVAGFPFGHSSAFPQILEDLLNSCDNETMFKVVNIGITATNSYAVADIASNLDDYEPDYVILYFGHNEYYGSHGVMSNNLALTSKSLKRFYIKIQKFRTVQLIKNLVQGIQSSPMEGTLMKNVALDKPVAFDSKEYHHGIEQFQSNLTHTLNSLEDLKATVILSNLVSNYRMSPFQTATIETDKLQLNYRQANTLFENGEYNEAQAIYKNIWDNDSSSAQLAHSLYKVHKVLNEPEKAMHYAELSKDLDLIRFRAPAKFNNIISTTGNQYENVHVVDMVSRFNEINPEQNLFLEHVHPTIAGYSLMAKTLKREVVKQLPASSNCMADEQEEINSYCISTVDSIYGNLLINRLKKNWPFVNSSTFNDQLNFKARTAEEQLAFKRYNQEISWAEMHNSAYKYYMSQNNYTNAFCEAKYLLDEYPTLDMPYQLAVNSLILQGDYKKGLDILDEKLNNDRTILIERLYIQLLLLDHKSKLAEEEAFVFYQKEPAKSREEIYLGLKALNALISDHPKVTLNSEAYRILRANFSRFGVPQAVNHYVE